MLLLIICVDRGPAPAAHACDLCGYYTPQIEAMTQPELSASGEPMPAEVNAAAG